MTTETEFKYVREGGIPRHTHPRWAGKAVRIEHLDAKHPERPYAIVVHSCGRCGDTGTYPSSMYDGVCLLCKGRAHLPKATKLYSQAELDRMNATRDKRRAKKGAEALAAAEAKAQAVAGRREAFVAEHGAWIANARAVAGHIEFVADILAKATNNAALSDKQIAAVDKAVARELETKRFAEASSYLGDVGAKVTVEGDVLYQDSRDGQFGTSYFHVIKTATGKVIFRGSSFVGGRGARVRFVATVKKHETDDRDGTKVTVVQRPRKLETLRKSERQLEREAEYETRRVEQMVRDAGSEAHAEKRPYSIIASRWTYIDGQPVKPS